MRLISLIACAAALALGILALLVQGLAPPPWLTGLEAMALAGAALMYGYTGRPPAVPGWLWLRPVRGAVLVVLGVGAIYVPPQLLLSAWLIGTGVRLVWRSACELATPPDRPRVELYRKAGGIARVPPNRVARGGRA